jgi:uncharacterized protein YbjT (DUF2867 family)
MKSRLIITGATGMVGEGVLHECLQQESVAEVLIINRRPSGMSHPRLKEIVHTDFFDLSAIATQLTGYDGCFFCLGVSSIGMKETEFFRLTHELTLHFATTLVAQSSNLTFCYVSGAGTDGSEKGRLMWARIKGKTENDLAKLPFKKFYAFRPGYMHPTKGLKNTLRPYRYISWLYPAFKFLFPKKVCTLAEVGMAMVNTLSHDYPKQVLEVPDIIDLAHLPKGNSR